MLGQFRALHASTYAKYQQFNDNPLGLDYSIVPHLMRKLITKCNSAIVFYQLFFLVAWKVAVGISPESLERGKLLQQQHVASGQLNTPKKRPSPIPIDSANKMERPTAKIRKIEEPESNEPAEPEEQKPVEEPSLQDEKVYFQFSYVIKRDELKVNYLITIFKLLLNFILNAFKQKNAEDLGGEYTKDYNKLTHLVMREAERTEKLLCALSKVKYVVSDKWISESAAQQKFLGT